MNGKLRDVSKGNARDRILLTGTSQLKGESRRYEICVPLRYVIKSYPTS